MDWPEGYPQNRLSQAELETKFLGLAATVLDRQSAGRIIDSVGQLECVSSLDELCDLLARRQS